MTLAMHGSTVAQVVKAEVGTLRDVRGGGWRSVTVPVDEWLWVLLCEIGSDDYGPEVEFFVDVRSPTGDEVAPLFSIKAPVPDGTMFIAFNVPPSLQQVQGRVRVPHPASRSGR